MPTIKQTEAFKRVVDNRGNVSKGMKEAGYEPKTCKNPKNLTESKGWQELMEEYLSENALAVEHNKVLKQDGDLKSKLKAVDLGYKLRGSYEPEKRELSGDLSFSWIDDE